MAIDPDDVGAGYNSIYSPNQFPIGSAAQQGAFMRDADQARAAEAAATSYNYGSGASADSYSSSTSLFSGAADSYTSVSYLGSGGAEISGKAVLVIFGIFLLGLPWLYEMIVNFDQHPPVNTAIYGNTSGTAPVSSLAAYANNENTIIDNMPLGFKVATLSCGEQVETVSGLNQDSNTAFGGLIWTKVYFPDRTTISYVPSNELSQNQQVNCQ